MACSDSLRPHTPPTWSPPLPFPLSQRFTPLQEYWASGSWGGWDPGRAILLKSQVAPPVWQALLATWRPGSCLPGMPPPVRLWLRPKPFLSTIPTPQEAPQSTELPSGPPGGVGTRSSLWPGHLQLMQAAPALSGILDFLTRDKSELRWGVDEEMGWWGEG